MSSSEKKLADYILDNSQLLRDYSSQQLANAVGVSQSSVVKFSQKLGYKGYPDLKLAVNESVAKGLSDSNGKDKDLCVEDDITSLSEKYAHRKITACNSSMELNSDQDMGKTIDCIHEAEHIVIVCDFKYRALMEQFARLLSQHKIILFCDDTQCGEQQIAHLQSSDLVIAASLFGKDPASLNTVQLAKSKGITTVSLTQYSTNQLANNCDINLFSLAEGEESAVVQLVNFACMSHLLEIIYLQYTQRLEAES